MGVGAAPSPHPLLCVYAHAGGHCRSLSCFFLLCIAGCRKGGVFAGGNVRPMMRPLDVTLPRMRLPLMHPPPTGACPFSIAPSQQTATNAPPPPPSRPPCPPPPWHQCRPARRDDERLFPPPTARGGGVSPR